MLTRQTLIVATAGVWLLSCFPVAAQEPITAIEEEWELQVGTPKPARSSPQVVCVMSTAANLDSTYAVFAVNQRNVGTSAGGGLQLQLWHEQSLLSSSDGASTASLSFPDERVCWTQRMSVRDGVLKFEILSGNSQTWGTFGGNGELVVSKETGLQNLNTYNPDCSANHAEVTFGSGCVDRLTLKKIRVYTGDQTPVVYAVDRVVYQHQ